MIGNADLATEVVAAVGEAEGTEPPALEQSLFEAVDGDALDRLFRNTTGQVVFEYHGYEVTVTSDGDVGLEGLAE